MAGLTDIHKILENLHPVLLAEEYVFCSIRGAQYGDFQELRPIGSFLEKEGLTLVLSKVMAESVGWSYSNVYKVITLSVHSSLESVGLTAVVSTKLAELGISANVIAGYFHDHIFVPQQRADDALTALRLLRREK